MWPRILSAQEWALCWWVTCQEKISKCSWDDISWFPQPGFPEVEWRSLVSKPTSVADFWDCRHWVCLLLFPMLSLSLSSLSLPFFPDMDECAEFPFVCPRGRPICINTYGGYRCRSNKRCNRGFEPNEDGTACVGEWWHGQKGIIPFGATSWSQLGNS